MLRVLSLSCRVYRGGWLGIPIRRFKSQLVSHGPFNVINYTHFRLAINTTIKEIAEDPTCTERAGVHYIEASSWLGFLGIFRRCLVIRPIEYLGSRVEFDRLCFDLKKILPSADSGSVAIDTTVDDFLQCKESLFQLILSKAMVDLSDSIKAFQSLNMTTDLKKPHEWYPLTRLMKRKIIFHGGPTNSGKTYHALQRLKEAEVSRGGGLYCGPLRLLALEVYEQLNRQGISTSLVTGQEKREIPGSTHVSSTLEMVSMTREYDVAVIDEIQMIADKDRGYAWTRALLGLRAREVHLCGGLEAEQLVRSLVASSGDEFVLQKYDRLSRLHIEEQSLRGDYTQVQAGDCIVAFSKSDIFSIRRQIEENTSFKCAVIYGQLPPDTRSTQARLFNEEGSGYDILVASDAIGMGLNLNIRRIVFHSTLKSDKNGVFWLEPSSVKQIAGRAGRLSSQYKVGLVTAWQEVDLAYVRAIMEWDLPPLKSAGIFPSIDQIETFGEKLLKMNVVNQEHGPGVVDQLDAVEEGEYTEEEQEEDSLKVDTNPTGHTLKINPDDIRLSALISKFVKLSQIDGRFFMCDHLNIIVISNWLHTIPLSIADRFIFSSCPVNIGDTLSMTLLYQFAAKYAMQRPVAVNIRLSMHAPRDLEEFGDLCMRHNILDLYLWLSNRFPKYFIEREVCLQQKTFAVQMIEDTLMSASFNRKYVHGTDYIRKRKSGHGNDLPPLQYGSQIRDKFREYIGLVPKDLRCILRDDVYEPSRVMSAARSLGSHHSSGGSNGRHMGRSNEALLTKSIIAHSTISADRNSRPVYNNSKHNNSGNDSNNIKHNNSGNNSNSRPGTSGTTNRDQVYNGQRSKSAAHQHDGSRTVRDDRVDDRKSKAGATVSSVSDRIAPTAVNLRSNQP